MATDADFTEASELYLATCFLQSVNPIYLLNLKKRSYKLGNVDTSTRPLPTILPGSQASGALKLKWLTKTRKRVRTALCSDDENWGIGSLEGAGVGVGDGAGACGR
jgi:hypothetical protein